MAEDIRNMAGTAGVKEFEKVYRKPYCVVLDSEYCSMGRMIAKKACDKTGYAYYDAVILLELVPDSGLDQAAVEKFEEGFRDHLMDTAEIRTEEYKKITAVFEKAIDIALSRGPCLIHDRATREMIEKKGYTCISVLTYGTDMEAKLVRASLSPLYRDIKDKALLTRKINEETNIRINYHRGQSETAWGDHNTYDLCLNTETLGRDFSAEVLAKLMQ